MSDNTAQIFEFTLTTDGGEVLGPFALADAEQAYRFDGDVTTRTLHLDVIDSNGGNTGLVEFAAYGTPLEPTDTQDKGKSNNEMNLFVSRYRGKFRRFTQWGIRQTLIKTLSEG